MAYFSKRYFIGLILITTCIIFIGTPTADAYLYPEEDWNPPYYPQVVMQGNEGVSMVYDYTSGVGGTLMIAGSVLGGNVMSLWAADKQQYMLDYTGSYLLKASFDKYGQYKFGSLTITGNNGSEWPGALIAGSYSLTGVWLEGTGTTGTLQFLFTNNITNTDFFGLDANLYSQILVYGLTGDCDSWDGASHNDNLSFWKTDHSASVLSATTWAPVPPAAWLLGSGLLGLIGLRRRFKR